MEKINVGVIGAGRIGKLHIENMLQHLPHIHIKYVTDPYLDESWTQKKSLVLTRDAEIMMDDPDIHAVFICSPSSLHVSHIRMAAQAGKHIFCEKPLASDVSQIELALRDVKGARVLLQVGFNRRFDANFVKIKQTLRNNGIGIPQLLRITSRDPAIPPADYVKTSGGLFLDMTIHDFDMARYLMDSEIEEIYASGNVLIDPMFKNYNDIDTAIINLKFANGALGVIDNSRQAVYGYDQRVEVFGSAGAIHADNNKPTHTTWMTKAGVMSDKPLYFFLERYKESFVTELNEFYHSITQQKPTSVSGKDGLFSVALSLAAQQSLQENRPIKMNYEKWSDL